MDCTSSDGRIWPLWYLGQLGLKSASSVRLIVATHWHSDHVKVISQVLEECSDAQFACSAALRTDEFKQIVARFMAEEAGATRPPLSEIRKCFQLLAARKGKPTYRPPRFANADRPLEKFEVGGRQVEIIALSPSDQDQLDAVEAFANGFVPVDQPATGLSPIQQNHASVVVVVRVDDEYLLLGADLERTASAHTGWNALVASKTRPQFLASIFKVPHHCSSNGQHEGVWSDMLQKEPLAVLTPYLSSRLPRPEGIEWLKSRTTGVYASCIPSNTRVRRRTEVERTIKDSTVEFSSQKMPDDPGIVRFRKKAGADAPWTVEVFGEAKKL